MAGGERNAVDRAGSRSRRLTAYSGRTSEFGTNHSGCSRGHSAAEPAKYWAVRVALLHGPRIASQRYLLRLPDLADAELDDVLRIAAPIVRSLISPDS